MSATSRRISTTSETPRSSVNSQRRDSILGLAQYLHAGINRTSLEIGVAGYEASGRNGGGATHFHSLLFMEEQRLWPIMLSGMRLHFGGHANPQRTTQAYAWALQDLGGRILQHTSATNIVRCGGRAVSVETPRGSFGLEKLVIAAGPQSAHLLATVGVRLPLAIARAEMIITEPAPLMPIGGVDGNGLYGRQTLRGNLAFGGGPHAEAAQTAAVASMAR
jgi:hypothetical protein